MLLLLLCLKLTYLVLCLDAVTECNIMGYPRSSRAGKHVQRSILSDYTRPPCPDEPFITRGVNYNNLVNVATTTTAPEPTAPEQPTAPEPTAPEPTAHIPVAISTHRLSPNQRQTSSSHQNGSNSDNLMSVTRSNRSSLKAAVLNVHSACNKATSLCEYVTENNLDIFAMTETWLKPIDQSVIAELIPPGYILHNVDRINGRGGGVAILHRENLKSHPKRSNQL